MEDNYGEWILTYSTYTILHKHKRRLEARHKVKIEMPELQINSPTRDKIFVRIVGDKRNIGFVKKFVKCKSKLLKNLERTKNKEASIILINSDSEDAVADSKVPEPMRKQPRLEFTEVCELSSIVINSDSQNADSKTSETKPKQPVMEIPEVCEVTSTTDVDESIIVLDPPCIEEFMPIKENKNKQDESIIILEPPCSEEFIPLMENKNNKRQRKNARKTPSNHYVTLGCANQREVIQVSSDEEDTVDNSQVVPIPVVPTQVDTKLLRPIVIDGQNVARQHGRATNTFSCKGIKICVDFFLKRGHTNVTALLPQFRRFCKSTRVVTTDQHILDELEKSDHLAYTPCRRIDGVAYNCYDDRFIVNLASQNGGVILSNDHYKDLIDESPLFAETIKNRLLMFCFVGDILLIPDDPLGPKGPKLAEYLSFPSSPPVYTL